MSEHIPYIIIGVLAGIVISQFIAVWALRYALQSMREGVSFNRECFEVAMKIADPSYLPPES